MQTFARHLDFTGIVTWIPCIDPVHFLGDSWKCRKALFSSCGVYLSSIALLYQKVQSVLRVTFFAAQNQGFVVMLELAPDWQSVTAAGMCLCTWEKWKTSFTKILLNLY